MIARGAPAVHTVTSPEAADVRESPALELMAEPAGLGVDISYADPHVPTVRLGETALQSSDQVESQERDLVIVHTVHPGCDPGWLGGQTRSWTPPTGSARSCAARTCRTTRSAASWDADTVAEVGARAHAGTTERHLPRRMR